MVETILSTPLVQQVILPFLLVFVVTFAVLQKTKVLGDGKKQIDALVALVIGLIVVTFGFATGLIVSLVPFLAVSLVVILVFMILYGMSFATGRDDEFKLAKGIKTTIGILAALGVLIVLAMSTGAWDYIKTNYISEGSGSSILINGIIIVVIVVALIFAIRGESSNKAKDK